MTAYSREDGKKIKAFIDKDVVKLNIGQLDTIAMRLHGVTNPMDVSNLKAMGSIPGAKIITHTIRATGTSCEKTVYLVYNNKSCLIEVFPVDDQLVIGGDCNSLFSDIKGLTSLDLRYISNKATNMSFMFYGCSTLQELLM